MRGVGVLGVGLLLAFPARAEEPGGAPAHAIYGWLATGVDPGAADRSSSFRGGADPDAQALAAGAMASLGANLAPNPLAACWAQFPPAQPAAGPKPALGSAAALVTAASGPLVIYGGRPGQVGDYPLPPLGPYPRTPFGARLGTAGGGVPLVGGVSVPGVDGPGDQPLTFDSTRGVSDTTGLTIPPGGWAALGLEAFPGGGPLGDGSEKAAPPEVIRETLTPPVTKAPIATPEPGTLLLAGVGLAALAGPRRKRVSRKCAPSASAG